MILLPRGIPVKEKVDPGKINLPDALVKLREGGFSGYLRFETPQGVGIIIFEQGKLISALYDAGRQPRPIAFDAIALLFEFALAGGCTLDIFRLSPELALSIHALLHGDVLYRGQELKLIDIKALLGQLREKRISGCLRIYTDEHVAMIFYRDGNPLGFFHDGSTEIQTTADTSMSVARLPGAKIDVLTSNVADGEVLADLLQAANIATLWQKAQEKSARVQQQQQVEQSRDQEQRDQERRQRLQKLLRDTAERHVGKIGGSLVDKEFERCFTGGFSDRTFTTFFDNLGKASKLVAGPTAVGTMLDEMKRGVRGLLK